MTEDRPGVQPHNELIVYQRAQPPAGSQIWVMDGDGKEKHEVSRTPAGASDTLPSMSLSEALVVWQRTAGGGAPQIIEGDIFGDPTRPLTNFSAGASHPTISRDGVYVAFSVGRGAHCDLWIVKLDVRGDRARRLTDHSRLPGCDTSPTFSPDARRIAFQRLMPQPTGEPAGGAEYVMPVAGGSPRELPLGSPLAVAWAPGSDFLVLTGGRVPSLQAISPSGRLLYTLISREGIVGAPIWAPDEARAAFAERSGDGSTDIISVSAAGGEGVDLTRSPGVSASNPSWGYPSNQGDEPAPGVHARSVAVVPHRRHR